MGISWLGLLLGCEGSKDALSKHATCYISPVEMGGGTQGRKGKGVQFLLGKIFIQLQKTHGIALCLNFQTFRVTHLITKVWES